MNSEHEDEQIKKLLKRWTDVDESIQQHTWEKIDDQLFPTVRKNQYRKRNWFVAITTAAAICIIMLGLFTQQGQAVVEEIKDLFVSEKQEIIEIEGNKEEADVKLQANESLDFVIYIDEDGYKMEYDDAIARIITKEPLGEMYPDVYMEIFQVIGQSKNEVINTIKDQLEDEKMIIFREEEVSDPLEGTIISGIEEDEATGDFRAGWDSMINQYLLVEVSDQQYFVIKQVYFQEAAEGHGARFDHMLQSFEIIH